MNLIDYNSSSKTLFSGNLRDVILEGIKSPEIMVSVWVGRGNSKIEFTLYSYEGKVVIRLKEIMEALASYFKEADVTAPWVDLYYNKVSIKFEEKHKEKKGGDSIMWEREIIIGTAPTKKEDIYKAGAWLTTKPKVAKTFVDSEEELWTLGRSGSISVKVYFKFQIPRIIPLFYSLGPHLLSVDASFNTVKGVLQELDYDIENILGYDVVFVPESSTVEEAFEKEENVQRFRLLRPSYPVNDFVFRNTLGAIEHIHAAGQHGKELEITVNTFFSQGETKELSNESELIYESNSGALESEDEVRYWYQFLTSKERYIKTSPVDYKRITVIDSESKSIFGEINNIKFRWKFAKQEPVFPVRKNKLKDLV